MTVSCRSGLGERSAVLVVGRRDHVSPTSPTSGSSTPLSRTSRSPSAGRATIRSSRPSSAGAWRIHPRAASSSTVVACSPAVTLVMLHLRAPAGAAALVTDPCASLAGPVGPVGASRQPGGPGATAPGRERCESGRIGLTANELTWETGSEGSNPSLSAPRQRRAASYRERPSPGRLEPARHRQLRRPLPEGRRAMTAVRRPGGPPTAGAGSAGGSATETARRPSLDGDRAWRPRVTSILLTSLRDLQWRARRFALAALATGIVPGLALMVSGVSNSFSVEIGDTVTALGARSWLVPAGSPGPFTESGLFPLTLAQQIAGREGPARAAPLLVGLGAAQVGRTGAGFAPPEDVNLLGVEPGRLGSPAVAQGRPLGGPGEAVVDESLGARLGGAVLLDGARFHVVGLLSGVTYFAGEPTAFVDIGSLGRLLAGRPVASAVLVRGPAGT